jgi:IPT/TIG domain
VEQNKPLITGVSPASVRPGDRLVIGGQNLMPPGSTGEDGVTATLEGVGALPVVGTRHPTGVVVEIPSGTPAGTRNVTVTTGAGVTTEGRSVEILSDRPELLGLVEPEIAPGDVVHLLGRNLRSALEAADGAVLVSFNEQWSPAELVEVNGTVQVAATTPRGLSGATTQVRVHTSRGVASDALTLPLSQRPHVLEAELSNVDGQVRARIVASGVLPPAGGGTDQHEVQINGVKTTVESEAIEAGSRDRLVVTAPRVATGEYTIVVKDYQGRASVPIHRIAR